MPRELLFSVTDLSVRYHQVAGIEGQNRDVLSNVWLRVYGDETVGVVGGSGCGKTTLALSLLGLIPRRNGQICWRNRDIARMNRQERGEFRRRTAMIFQDAAAAFHPRRTVGESLLEGPRYHRFVNRSDEAEFLEKLLTSVGLPADSAHRWPDSFSGGERQRLGIARALALEPDCVICDEPLASLDLSVQAQVINLLLDLRRRRRTSWLFISHDLAVVRHLCSYILVMHEGEVVECAARDDLFASPFHPVTRELLEAAGFPTPAVRDLPPRLEGTPWRAAQPGHLLRDFPDAGPV